MQNRKVPAGRDSMVGRAFENSQTDFQEDEEHEGWAQNWQQAYPEASSRTGLDESGTVQTFTSVSLLDVTDQALRPPPKTKVAKNRGKEMEPGQRSKPKKMVNPLEILEKEGKISPGGKKSSHSSNMNQSGKPGEEPEERRKSSRISQNRSLDEVLAMNENEMEKSHHSRSQSDNQNLSGNNLKMDTSLEKSRTVDPPKDLSIQVMSEISRIGGKATGAQPRPEEQRDSTDTQKGDYFQMHSTEIERVNNQSESHSESNKRPGKSPHPMRLLGQPAPGLKEQQHETLLPQADLSMLSFQQAPLNLSLEQEQHLAMQIELNKERLRCLVEEQRQ